MDSAIPSGNAVAVMNYLRLFFFTGEQDYMDHAEQTLGVFRAQMDHNAYGSAAMLCALDFYLAKPKEIVLLGARTDPAMQALVENIHGRYVPNKTLVLVDPTGAADAAAIPAAAKGKAALDGKPTAYICHNFTCSHPLTDWAALEELL